MTKISDCIVIPDGSELIGSKIVSENYNPSDEGMQVVSFDVSFSVMDKILDRTEYSVLIFVGIKALFKGHAFIMKFGTAKILHFGFHFILENNIKHPEFKAIMIKQMALSLDDAIQSFKEKSRNTVFDCYQIKNKTEEELKTIYDSQIR